jgi:hypothetical protein
MTIEMRKTLRGAVVAMAVSAGGWAAWNGAANAQAGLLTGGAEELEPPITLSSGKPLAEKPYELESGKYYSLEIEADGSAELALEGPQFFRNVWIDEIIINDIEIRPLGVDSLEFDDEGTVTMSFVTIRPGRFELRIPGASGDGQVAVFNVK